MLSTGNVRETVACVVQIKLFYRPIMLFYSPNLSFYSPIILFYSPNLLFYSPIMLFNSPNLLFNSPVMLFYSPIILFYSPSMIWSTKISQFILSLMHFTPAFFFNIKCINMQLYRFTLNLMAIMSYFFYHSIIIISITKCYPESNCHYFFFLFYHFLICTRPVF